MSADWMLFVILYGISVPLFLLIDLVWLGVVAKSFYRRQLGHLMGDINWPAALTFYAVFLVGLVLFAVYGAVSTEDWQAAALWGGLFGFFTYATYDLTNLATLRNWPLAIVVVDIAWGTVLGASVSLATYGIYGWLFS